MAVINNLGGGSVNFTPLDNALDELDNVINGAYETVLVLPFTFTGNTVTGYTGSDTNIVIPASYSLGESEEVAVDGVLFTLEELVELPYRIYSSFNLIEFKDVESDYTEICTDQMQLETLPAYFPSGAYLTMADFSDSMGALDLGYAFDSFDKFPITCNGTQFQDVSSYEEYINSLSDAVSLTFNGTITIQTYITGNDYVVTSIGDNAFEFCSSLVSVTIPEGVTWIGYGAFANCEALTSITIPSSVASIGGGAFQSCTSLTSITIPEGVTGIDSNVFTDCTSLTSITIPNGVTWIGYAAFRSCTSLTSITIPNSVTSIGERTFFGCSGITSITIPSSVASIGNYAFYGCSGITSIVVDSGNTTYDSRENSNTIIKTSTNTLIWGCKNSTIPNSVTSIGSSAFASCTGLTSVTIGSGVTSIGSSAFASCTGLTSITIPEGVTRIEATAFNDCSSLSSITIPNSVTSIAYGAFAHCTGLTEIYCNAVNPPTLSGTSVFDNTNNAPIYVPSQSVSTYKSATNWSAYASRIQAISN